ncbi:MAG: hypothetical protein K2X77_31740 [Candidatus Obscuribacterales bacterium]|jgi:hypothetical protein|nr:hypothetical protein [Candidatus Obscuribacterales bacterium]
MKRQNVIVLAIIVSTNVPTKSTDGISKGALETAAELMSYILGSKDEVAEHVKNASDNTYRYLKGKVSW